MASDDAAPKVSETAPAPADDLVTTHHTLVTPGGEFAYTVTAGRIVLSEEIHEDGVFRGWKPKAELFVTAYTRDEADR